MDGTVRLKRGAKVPAASHKSLQRQHQMMPANRSGVGATGIDRLRIAAAVAAGSLLVAALLWFFGIPQAAASSVSVSAAKIGFRVDAIEVAGEKDMPKATIETALATEFGRPIFEADIGEMRGRLQALAWVKKAAVSRRLPDTIDVIVVERRPAAIWQFKRKLYAVDEEGIVLDRADLSRYATLPMVVGRGANVKVGDLLALLDTQPELRRRTEAAVWVGERRWDLKLDTGQTIALPEGAKDERWAVAKFAEFDEAMGLVGSGYIRFDMRLMDRMVLRRREI